MIAKIIYKRKEQYPKPLDGSYDLKRLLSYQDQLDIGYTNENIVKELIYEESYERVLNNPDYIKYINSMEEDKLFVSKIQAISIKNMEKTKNNIKRNNLEIATNAMFSTFLQELEEKYNNGDNDHSKYLTIDSCMANYLTKLVNMPKIDTPHREMSQYLMEMCKTVENSCDINESDNSEVIKYRIKLNSQMNKIYEIIESNNN